MNKWSVPIIVVLLALAALGGYRFGRQPQTAPAFHDIRITPPRDLVALIAPQNPSVRKIAEGFRSYDEAYAYVSDQIRFVPFAPPGPVDKTIAYGYGSCLGKAALLCSLYRAMGMPAEDARLVMGIVMTPQGPADHVWVDLEHGGRCLQQDPSGMLGRFAFDQFPDNRYVEYYVVKESCCFNENGFALVSQLNRLRGSTPD